MPVPPFLGLVIGQTPRDDLLVPVRSTLDTARVQPLTAAGGAADGEIALAARGALDGMTADAPIFLATALDDAAADADANAAAGTDAACAAVAAAADATVDASDCPLITRLAAGTPVTVSEAALVPLLQAQLAAHARALGGAPFVAILLCAGRFDGLCAPSVATTLVKPFEVLTHTALSHATLSCAMLSPHATLHATLSHATLSPRAFLPHATLAPKACALSRYALSRHARWPRRWRSTSA